MAFRGYMLSIVGIFVSDKDKIQFTFSRTYSVTLGDKLDDYDLQKNDEEITKAINDFTRVYSSEGALRLTSLSHDILEVPS